MHPLHPYTKSATVDRSGKILSVHPVRQGTREGILEVQTSLEVFSNSSTNFKNKIYLLIIFFWIFYKNHPGNLFLRPFLQ